MSVAPELREAKQEDAPLVADILAEAFADDPVMNWMLGGPRGISRLFSVLTKHVYLKHGFGDIVGEHGATLWLPASKRFQLSLWRQIELAGCIFSSGGFGAVRRMTTSGDILAATHPRTPHYYLFAVGVRRSAQGAGLGGALVRAGLARADKDDAAAYLENSKTRNTPLYERLGFKPTGWLPLPQGAPPLLAMLRPAAKAGAM